MPALRPSAPAAFLVLIGCGGGSDVPICSRAESPSLQALCALDQAVDHPGGSDARLEACDAIESTAWRDGCVVQVAEQRAFSGDLPGAFDACLGAAAVTRTCLEQVAWLGVQGRVRATPESSDAAAQVDAHVATLPAPGMVGALRGYRSAEPLARAAAWHGIYAGSGSTDPTALLSATQDDLPLARAALAWEAVRLAPADLPVDDLVDAIHDIIAGTRAPFTGSPLAQACWTDRPMPRVQADFRWKPVVRAYGSWSRFTDTDPRVDLEIAVYDAIVMHRGALASEHLFTLKAHPAHAMQKAVARYVALLAPSQCDNPDSDAYANHCAEFGWVERGDDTTRRDVVRYVLNSTRKGVRDGLVPRLAHPEGCR